MRGNAGAPGGSFPAGPFKVPKVPGLAKVNLEDGRQKGKGGEGLALPFSALYGLIIICPSDSAHRETPYLGTEINSFIIWNSKAVD